MATIWEPTTRQSIAQRATKLTASATPGWGKMNAAAMMAHLNDSFRMALGDLPVKPKNSPLRYKPIRYAVIHWLPVPKGVPTAPELIARCNGASLDEEQRAFQLLLDRIGAVTPETRLAAHPAFGALSYDLYGRLMAKHVDHHLRQFGL